VEGDEILCRKKKQRNEILLIFAVSCHDIADNVGGP